MSFNLIIIYFICFKFYYLYIYIYIYIYIYTHDGFASLFACPQTFISVPSFQSILAAGVNHHGELV